MRLKVEVFVDIETPDHPDELAVQEVFMKKLNELFYPPITLVRSIPPVKIIGQVTKTPRIRILSLESGHQPLKR